MRYIIKNWRKYQHYKGRRPPWIKVHKSILTSEDWVNTPDASKVLLFVCMMAAQLDQAGDGSFNGSPAYLKKVCCLDKAPNLQPLLDCKFIVEVDDASISLEPCKQVVPPSVLCVSVSEEGGVGETKTLPAGAAGLAFQFHFLWSLPEKMGKKPYSPTQIEPTFAEFLRLHPSSYEAALAEIERKGRNRNEWPDKLIKRLSDELTKLPAQELQDGRSIMAKAKADLEELRRKEAEAKNAVA